MCINIHIKHKEAETERDIEKIKRRLKKEGWVPREGQSHTVYKHPDKPGRVILPRHKGDLPTGTAKDIAREAGWD